MAHHVCPWWLGYFLINPFRRLLQDPRKILGEHLKEGMAALEPGPGLGFFTLEMARIVGPSGHVVTVDTQPRMVEGLKSRVSKAGFTDHIDCRLVTSENLGLEDCEGRIDFALVFAMAHEVSDLPRFLCPPLDSEPKKGLFKAICDEGYGRPHPTDKQREGWRAELMGFGVSEQAADAEIDRELEDDFLNNGPGYHTVYAGLLTWCFGIV